MSDQVEMQSLQKLVGMAIQPTSEVTASPLDPGVHATNDVGPSGDAVTSEVGWFAIPPGAITNIQTFTLNSVPKERAASEEVWVQPYDMELADTGKTVEIAIAYEQ